MLRPLRSITSGDLKKIVLANAVGSSALTIKIGDAITAGATTHAAFATQAATTSKILGIVTGIICNNQKVTELDSILGVNAAKVGAISTGPGSDNETYKVWSVEYIPSYVPMEYEADIDNVVGTTTDDNGIGSYFTITSGTPGTILNASALLPSTAFTSATQITSLGYTPYNTKKIFCKISPSFVV